MTHSHGNLLGEPPATLLPAEPDAERELAEGLPAASAASASGSPGSRVAGGSPSRLWECVMVRPPATGRPTAGPRRR